MKRSRQGAALFLAARRNDLRAASEPLDLAQTHAWFSRHAQARHLRRVAVVWSELGRGAAAVIREPFPRRARLIGVELRRALLQAERAAELDYDHAADTRSLLVAAYQAATPALPGSLTIRATSALVST